ncbi:putative FMN-dependent luciferase-like monooxygenase [Rhizobium leguminosarum]|uniref:FMN-dependent luciferase-like monooxygenase n=1 Tax=Rhizobium leguminosarum TaxID=384 RepID=A0AAE2MRI2_RHILE|nr:MULTISPECIES: putative FMN-dependent luciferase-like monooxygenase [Rhizobium]MBB4294167.1 putative FMN-dependent luciferase-like monooxygenase [Rhizobium leguminosarum]MBB4300663.1 putative FMN-dependent luciferase-like monooxygenase [Rhizobium leguminosarum]MBB4312025.1 putative FMN-dependent luciferase-like monooxygenase [Rhizobium leguminosarum]MBB4421005.1 putative FMN-dependent luciferase-like monooxygenase [Rhizobium leguminosarum]MBB4436193.1 putative FMN-dependent luciferase-like m
MTEQTTAKRLGFFTRLLDDVEAGERYRLAEEQIIHAEANGFDSAWIAQHHFHADEGGLPSPAVFLAHVAARTSTIRLGTGVITLPMENPLRVAEDTAVTDLLSGGRLEVGFGTGGTRESFEAFGIPADKRSEVYGKYLGIVRRAWAGEDIGAGNRLYPSAPHLLDRIWLATFSAVGAKLAGETGDGLMLSRTQPRPADNPHARLDDIQNPIIDAYLAALPKDRAPRIFGSRSLFVADDRKQALKLAEAGLSRVADRFAAAGHRIPGNSVQDLIKALDSHVGTPDDVIASLRADTALARATDIVFQVHSIDPPPEYTLRSIELIASEVASALGWRRSGNSKRIAAE